MKIALALGLFATALVPLLASAEHLGAGIPDEGPPQSTTGPYEFKQEGVLGCNQVAGALGSAGTMAAIGGVYVPVNDAAVTLNTGILIYMHCILNPLQTRIRDSVIGSLVKKQFVEIETGRNGNKLYVVDIDDEIGVVDDRATLTYLTGPALDTVHPQLKDKVRRALAINYRAETSGTGKQDCGYEGDLQAETTDPTAHEVNLKNFEELAYPSCIPFFEFLEKKDERDATRAAAKANQMKVWDWGRGFYAVTDNAQDPFNEKILTPSSVVQEGFQQTLGLSQQAAVMMRQVGDGAALALQNLLSVALDGGGLAGLSQSIGGRPSYLEQIAKETSAGVVGAAVNAALTILNAARQIEGSYLASMNAIVANLTQTINQLRTAERQCWNLVVPKAQDYASQNGFSLDTVKIKSATSSLAFSQQVIDSQIKPIADVAVANVQTSQKALSLVDQLIAGVTNTSSLTAQRLALQQLDTLVAQKALHTQYDAQNAAKQKDDVAAAMGSLVTDTITAWADSPDPSIGLCNINNPTVVQACAERWKK